MPSVELELLNSIGHTAANPQPGQSDALIQAVLDRCVSELPVEHAVVYLKAEQTLLCASSPTAGTIDKVMLTRLVRRDIFHVSSGEQKAVIRRGGQLTDKDSPELLPHHDRLLVPIVDAFQRVLGLLAFVANSDGVEPFGRDECNLLELLLRPINRIVNFDNDAATGLLNKAGFFSRLTDLLQVDEAENYESCLLQIRFGQLLSIGDSCGSEALDQAVLQLAAILEKRIRKRDLAARTGSSDFLLYLKKCSVADAENLCCMLLDTLKGYRFSHQDKLFSINAFVGVAPLSSTSRDARALLDASDAAVVEAMNNGINNYVIYEPTHKVAVRNNGLIVWPEKISQILKNDHLRLYTQPIASLDDRLKIEHHEVLLRVKSDDSLLVAPSVFVRAAERYRMINEVNHWVINSAFAKLNDVYTKNPRSSLTISINVSGETLNENFPALIGETMEGMVFPANAVLFEITETSAVSNMKHVVKVMRALQRQGFGFILDDFGAGMGSFAFLQNLSVDAIKIDGALIRGVAFSDVNYAIVESVQSVCKTLQLRTIAKLVDNEEVYARLKSIGVDSFQGHLIAKPLPIAELTTEPANPANRRGQWEGHKP